MEGDEPFAVTLMVVLRSDDMSEMCRSSGYSNQNDYVEVLQSKAESGVQRAASI